jgi:Fic family protein
MPLGRDLLPFDPHAVAALCRELDAWRARLDSKNTLLRSWDGRLRRDVEAEAVAASTSMEGVPVTVEEVRHILIGEKPPEVSPASRDLVDGYREAMGYVLRRSDDPNFRWNRELLVGLHDRILAGHHGAGAGRLRSVVRRIANNTTGRVVFHAADWEDVPGLVDQMCDLVGSIDHPATAAAWVHVATAAIHPFEDGNGRSARVLASLAMYRGGFRRWEFTSLEEFWGRHLPDYYGAFACLGSRFDRRAAVTLFIAAHVGAQLAQVRALDMRERILRRVYAALLTLLEGTGIDRRAVDALWDGFLGFPVTPGYYAAVADVSRVTASHDLGRAVAAGLLEPRGSGRGRRYVASERLYEGIAGILDLRLAAGGGDARRQIIVEVADRIHAWDLDRGRLAQEPLPELP